VHVQKIGDRYFLGGKAVDDGNMKGAMLWVPLDKVTSIAELDSVEKTRDAFKASQKGMISGLSPADPQKP
jgi:hypothetical protein